MGAVEVREARKLFGRYVCVNMRSCIGTNILEMREEDPSGILDFLVDFPLLCTAAFYSFDSTKRKNIEKQHLPVLNR